MPSNNRKRVTVERGAATLMYPVVSVPGFDDIGMVTVGSDEGRLLRNQRTGAYVMHIRGAIRSLDERKVLAALGSNASKMDDGKRRNVYMSDRDAETLKTLGDGNLSEGIRLAAKQHQK